MGREIRRVPLDWEHPTDERGDYMPMYDQDYESAANEWVKGFLAWERGKNPDRARVESEKGAREYYWEWLGEPPNQEYYRPKWDDGAVLGYCMYETVTEGTPVSPVFAKLDSLVDWLVGQGYSRKAAERFTEYGYAPSIVVRVGEKGIDVADGIESYNI